MHGVFDKFDSGIIPTSLTAAISLSHPSLEVLILQQQQVVPANSSIYDMPGISNMQLDGCIWKGFYHGPIGIGTVSQNNYTQGYLEAPMMLLEWATQTLGPDQPLQVMEILG